MDNYLVIQAARFGDLIQSKRLMLSLKNIGKIHLLVDRSLCEFAKNIYPFANIYGISFHDSINQIPQTENFEIFRLLKNTNFKKVYNCNYSTLSSTICRLFDDEIIIGYRPSHSPNGGILRSGWGRLTFRLASNRSLATLNLVDFWGWFLDYPIDASNVNVMAEGKGGGIGVALSGRNERRSLPADILAQIISTIYQLSDSKNIKLFGTKNEIIKANKVIHLLPQKFKNNIHNFIGKTSILDLDEEVSNLDLLITPDTGIMHLAAHKGVPVIAFFLSSANCHETGPYGKGHLILQANTTCSPCLEAESCTYNIKCLSPFRNKLFLRELASLYQGKIISDITIENLQCWRSCFDDLGQKLKLVKGHDWAHDKRDYLRGLIKNYIGISQDTDLKSNLLYLEKVELIKKFFPKEEWMLPNRRYA